MANINAHVYLLHITCNSSGRVCVVLIICIHINLSVETPNTAITSEFIKSASISISGSSVQITCEFSDDYPAASCVLVYREYGNTTLVVEEYTRNNKPPENIVLDNPNGSYTFAIFGKNGNVRFDPEPVATKRYMHMATGATTTEEPSQTIPHPSSKFFIFSWDLCIYSVHVYACVYMYMYMYVQ